MAARLCAQAVACGTNGKAAVAMQANGSSISHASASYCEMIFTTQCGPQAPASDVPLVRDPLACGQSLASATCSAGAIVLPTACGGS